MHLARGVSYLSAVAISLVVILLGGALADGDLLGGMLRNLLCMAGMTLATSALVGVTYTWVPVVVVCGAAVLSPSSENPWSLYGLLFHPRATPGQLAVGVALVVAGLAIAVGDPVSRGYLRRR